MIIDVYLNYGVLGHELKPVVSVDGKLTEASNRHVVYIPDGNAYRADSGTLCYKTADNFCYRLDAGIDYDIRDSEFFVYDFKNGLEEKIPVKEVQPLEEVSEGVSLWEREAIEEDQTTWDEYDEYKSFDFSSHPYWVTTNDGIEPRGFDDYKEAYEFSGGEL